jgi:cytochrome P450
MNCEVIVDHQAYSDPGRILEIMSGMRQTDGLVRVEASDYRPFWAVSKYDQIRQIEMNHSVFLAEPRTQLIPIEKEEIAREKFGTANGLVALVNMDGEKHRKHRNITREFFMPSNLASLQGSIDEMAKHFVDKMASMGGECDFAADVAFFFPLRVMMSLIGVPEEDELKILQYTQQLFGYADEEFSIDESGKKREDYSAVEGLMTYFSQMVVDRQENPRDDIATLLATAQIDGEPMGQMELLSYFIIAATAGHDTTSATIAGGLQALLEHPDQMATLRADMSLLPAAVDEMIRWVCPVKHFVRTASEDVDVGGTLIKKGESVCLLFWSACRDEDMFEYPERFDISRKPNKHLAFGFGPHVCLGQHLAKMEIIAFFEELLPRLEEVATAGEPKMLQSNFVSGLKSLPVSYQML